MRPSWFARSCRLASRSSRLARRRSTGHSRRSRARCRTRRIRQAMPGWTLIGLPRTAARARRRSHSRSRLYRPVLGRRSGRPHHSRRQLRDAIPSGIRIAATGCAAYFYRRSAKSAARVLTMSAFSAVGDRGRVRHPAVAHHRGAARRASGLSAPGDPNLPLDLPATSPSRSCCTSETSTSGGTCRCVVDALLAARRRFGAAAALSLVLAGVDRGVGDGLCAMAARCGRAGRGRCAWAGQRGSRARALSRRRPRWSIRHSTKGSACRSSKRWRAERRCWRRTRHRFRKCSAAPDVLLDPRDVAAWRDAIIRVVNDESLRDDLRRRGLARAATYTWQRTARLTLDVYREAVRAA